MIHWTNVHILREKGVENFLIKSQSIFGSFVLAWNLAGDLQKRFDQNVWFTVPTGWFSLFCEHLETFNSFERSSHQTETDFNKTILMQDALLCCGGLALFRVISAGHSLLGQASGELFNWDPFKSRRRRTSDKTILFYKSLRWASPSVSNSIQGCHLWPDQLEWKSWWNNLEEKFRRQKRAEKLRQKTIIKKVIIALPFRRALGRTRCAIVNELNHSLQSSTDALSVCDRTAATARQVYAWRSDQTINRTGKDEFGGRSICWHPVRKIVLERLVTAKNRALKEGNELRASAVIVAHDRWLFDSPNYVAAFAE